MAKKKTVADQSKSGHVSSFTGGLNTDLHPMLQPNDTLTDCVNGTLITYNGNENMLQNDMGNYELKHAQLPEGYIPMGMKEHQGVLYIASWNPFEKKAQIGSYPSPKTVFGEENGNDYTINPIEIGDIEVIDKLDEKDLAELIFNIAEKNADVDTSKHLVSELDFSSSEVIFTNDFDESTMLGPGDRYWLSSDSDSSYEDEFQNLTYFLIDKDKNKHYITEEITVENAPTDSADINKFNPVTFEHSGWLGAKYELKDIEVPDVDVTITENPKTSENYSTGIQQEDLIAKTDENTTGWDLDPAELNTIEELWYPDTPAYRVQNKLYDVDVEDTYRVENIDVKKAPESNSNDFETDNPLYSQPLYLGYTDAENSKVIKEFHLDNSHHELAVETGVMDLVRNTIKAEGITEIDLYIPRGFKADINFEDKITIKNLVIPGKYDGQIPNSQSVTNLYTIEDNSNINAQNKLILDHCSKFYIAIDNSFHLGERVTLSTLVGPKHIEIFGTDIYTWGNYPLRWGNLPEGERRTIYINAPMYRLNNACPDCTFIIKDFRLSTIISDKATDIVVLGSAAMSKKISLNVPSGSNIWIDGDIWFEFKGEVPENIHASNVHRPRVSGYDFILSEGNTCVEMIVKNGTVNEPDAVYIPEGIEKIGKYALREDYTTVYLPSTLQEIVSSPNPIKIDNLHIRGNYRPKFGNDSNWRSTNVYVVPNNLYYYNKNHIFYTSGTTYHSVYETTPNNSLYKKFTIGVDFDTEYKPLSKVIKELSVPYIIVPQGQNLRSYDVHFERRDENKLIITYTNGLGNSTLDFSYYPKFNKIRINTDCSINSGIVKSGQEWTVTKNSTIDLSELKGGNLILNVLGISDEKDLNRFISSIIFPSLEESTSLLITIRSSANVEGEDSPKPGITIKKQPNSDYATYSESDTIELTTTESWIGYNIDLVGEGSINSYTMSEVEIGTSSDNNKAKKLLLDKVGHVLTDSTLITPKEISGIDDIMFSLIINLENYENSLDAVNDLVGNVVLEGPVTTGCYKYDYRITASDDKNSTLNIETRMAINKTNIAHFGLKLSTPLFKYEDDKLFVKNFYASFHEINNASYKPLPPQTEIIINTDRLQDNCGVAVKLQCDKTTEYCILNNQNLSYSVVVDKSDSYELTSYAFKTSGSKLLIEDLNVKPITINKNSIADDLSVYKYGYISGTKTMKVKLEWPQAIDQSNCSWSVSDLEGNVVLRDIVSENLFFDTKEINIDCSELSEAWYIFTYSTSQKVYKRPLFIKTKVTYDGVKFINGPNCTDYTSAYYEDLASGEVTTLNYKSEDVPSELSEMQIWHKKRGNYFTWDPQYFKESPKALWWELMDEFSDNEEYYLGTRKYQKVTLDFEKFGFVKGVTEYSVELDADGYDVPQIIQSYGVYDENNNKNTFLVPVGESIQRVSKDVDEEQVYPFKKEYLIQNSYSPIEFDYKTILSEENIDKISKVCGWDKGKMLCIDKTGGETNDCSISLFNPSDYNPNTNSFANGKIISGEGNFVSKILSKVDNLFVPIITRVRTMDNGFVFPVVTNNEWEYKVTPTQARTKKNSDNKRSAYSDNGILAITHAIANMEPGIRISNKEWIEHISLGTTCKLLALRSKTSKDGQIKDLLILPLWGKQNDLNKFEGQIRYDSIDWSVFEKLMLYIGSRVYAKVYSDNSRYIPKFNEEDVINNKAFKLTVKFKNIDKKSGGISLKSLEKTFSTIYGIQTNNFKLKVSEIEHADVNFAGKFDIKNKWKEVLNGEVEYSTLDYQIKNWCSTDKSGNSVPIVENMEIDTKIKNFVTCLAFDPLNRCFYYSEDSNTTWYEEDPRWAFGPNRGGCRMRIKRNFRKKNGDVSKDKDWIDIGEFPRFNNDVITPIAYPILPFCDEDTKPNRSENIANTYIKSPGKGNTPVYMETIDLNITNPEDIITKDCMNYLEYIFYDKNKEL